MFCLIIYYLYMHELATLITLKYFRDIFVQRKASCCLQDLQLYYLQNNKSINKDNRRASLQNI